MWLLPSPPFPLLSHGARCDRAVAKRDLTGARRNRAGVKRDDGGAGGGLNYSREDGLGQR